MHLRPGVVFANRDEAAALSIDGPVAGSVTVVKRGPDPAIVFTSDTRSTSGAGIEVPGIAVSRSVDTTGAGDAFARRLPAAPRWLDRRSDRCLRVRPPLRSDTAPGPGPPTGR